MKKIISLITALVLVMTVLAACSGNSDGNGKNTNTGTNGGTNAGTEGDEASKETRTVVFATITNYYTDGLKQAAEEYTKLHPETKVTIDIATDNSAFITSFQAKMAAGGKDAPDIVHANLTGDSPDNNLNKGWLLPLDEFAKKPNPYNNDVSIYDGVDEKYHPNMLTASGKIFMLPFDLVGTGFYYNKKIFEEVGITEAPTTWEDLFAALQKIKEKNYIPLAMPFNIAADYEGWMRSAFMDWTARSLIPEILVQPGDARNTPDVESVNSKIKYEPGNPMFDVGGIVDEERVQILAQEGRYDNQGPAEQKYWTTLKELSKFYQPGYATTSDADLYKLFISGKAAVYWNGSWQVGQLVQDQQKLGDKGFEWGTFKFPTYKEKDPNFPDEPRGILVPGHQLSIVNKKDAEQQKRTEDFLQYLFSPEVAQKVYETTLAAGQFVQGPSLVKGVTLSDEINAYLEGFKVSGNMNGSLGTLSGGNTNNDQTLLTEAKALQLQYYMDKIDLAEFLKQKAEFAKKANKKFIEGSKFDLDVKTNP